MWLCLTCATELADRYQFCWQCGSKRVARPQARAVTAAQNSVPAFESYEELAKVPAQPSWVGLMFRRGIMARLTGLAGALLFFGILKFFDLPIVRGYGLYAVVIVAVIALVVILWRSFRRHPSEGVGLKLD